MTILVQAKDNLYCDVTHQESNYKIITSAKGGNYPGPMEVLLEAVGACMLSNIMYRTQGKIALLPENLSCVLIKDMEEKPVHKLLGIKIEITVKNSAHLSDTDKQTIAEAAQNCPVKKTLRDDIKIQIEIKYPKSL